MREAHNLDAWDAAVAAFLSSRLAIGRDYRNERWILRNLRSFLERSGSADLDAALFDRWREQFQHLSSSTRFAREHTVNKLCRYRRRSEPDCFLPDQESLARQKPHPLATIVEPAQVAHLLDCASQLPPGSRSPVRAQVMRLAVVLLYTAGARAYTGDGFFNSFKLLLRSAGIRDSTGRCPRVQDFRHSFAVSALLRWYEADADVQSNLPKLALYMGHVSIVSTAYYLRWMPAVISQASARFARSCAGVIEGGAS